ncbi:MAG TPA: pyruvate dehydrogenase complex dihydrolipoamide acetyltransferase [Rubrobacteraceae bacterium]|nr:pyruvate dehydrogenase complex dihydrolipoamide acetyltransferase [Rubrobacteraceae bacterium]
MPEVIMPKMGDAMEEGTLVKWLKSEGDEVSEGDAIAEIETDKVTLELEAENAGTLAQLIADEGQDIPVGEAIAFIQGEGEEVPERDGKAQESEEAEGAEEEGGDGQAQAATATEAPEEAAEEEPTTDGRADGRFRASPIVRRLAQENDLDLSKIEGTGPAGRIVERDVRAAMERGDAQADGQQAAEAPEAAPEPAPAAAAPAPTGAPGTEIKEMPRMQRVIAERMTQAKQQIPHFYATVEVEMNELMALRKQLNEQLEEQGIKLSINDFVMKACAVALKEYPNLNSLWTSEGIELHEQVDLAMAVALEAGLITPVIRDAANKTLSAISAASKDLAKRAREGGLKPEEYQGGTFTVSNMGMFGVESFAAIINPPQAAIVGVSSIMQRAIFKDEEVVPVSLMKLTLSADHRIANGAEGAQYMAEVKRLLEHPMTLVV